MSDDSAEVHARVAEEARRKAHEAGASAKAEALTGETGEEAVKQSGLIYGGLRWGYPVWLRWVVGGIEVAGGFLLLVPWVASYAASAFGLVMAGAWIARVRDARFVDLAWITVYFVALLWIAFEWWPFRLPRGRRGKSKESAA